MEYVRNHRDIKLITTEARRAYLVLEPNYHTTKAFPNNLLAIEMKRTQILMNKPIYIGLSVLEISKIVMYEFCYDYVRPKYGEKKNLCYMITYSFIVYTRTEEIYIDIVKDFKTKFDTSNCKLERPLPMEKIKK